MATKIKVTIDTLESDELHPLYHKYQGEVQAQGAFIELDVRDGNLYADWDPEVGSGAPADVWNGYRRRYAINPELATHEINRLLNEVAPIAQRILDGVINGLGYGDNEHPELSPAGGQAEQDMEQACQVITETNGVYDAADWFQHGDDPTVTADTTDEQIDELAAKTRSEAQIHDSVSLTDVDTYLTYLRDELAAKSAL